LVEVPKDMPEKLLWAAIAAGTGYVASRAIDAAARRGWKALRGAEPPDDPQSPDTEWRDALLWTAAFSLVAGVGQLLATRAAAAGYARIAGHEPPA
jgi:hypothetical protein